MEARLHRRVQRYGWDMAAAQYEPLWRTQLAPAQDALLEWAALQPGERVLDIACGTGLVAFAAVQAVGRNGRVLGIDMSDRMIDLARRRAADRAVANANFVRGDAESLTVLDAGFDVALCALGLMYMADPAQALREMRRLVRAGGRLVVAVWGERARCGWSPVFPIIEAEVASEVCPLFFELGEIDTLAALCADAGFEDIRLQRLAAPLFFRDADSACDAALIGGPMALAWARFGPAVRARVRARYLRAIEPWRSGGGYALPGEFLIAAATVPR